MQSGAWLLTSLPFIFLQSHSINREVVKETLGVTVSKLDPSVFIWHNEGNLEGVMYTRVDDFLVWKIPVVHQKYCGTFRSSFYHRNT